MRIVSVQVRSVALVAAVAFLGCQQDLPIAPDYDNIRTIVYSRHVQPLFDQRCATSGCHNSGSAAAGLKLDSWENVFRGSEHGASVIPFRSRKSHLIFHVNRDPSVAPMANPPMPPDGPLSPAEVRFLMRWIDEGARNDAGDVPFERPRLGKVYVTNQADDEVAVIDIESQLLMRMVPVGALDNASTPPEAPHNITLDPQGLYYYINLIVANEIWKFRVLDDGFVAKLSLGSLRSPAQIAITPDGNTGFVSNFDLTGTHRGVQVFDTQSMQLTGSITDQRIRAVHGAQLSRDGLHLWTANEQSDNIAIIDIAARSVVEVIKVDPTVPDLPLGPPRFGPYQMVFSPDGATAYVTCRTSHEVRVIDTQTRGLMKVIPVGTSPLILDITPDGRFVYVANRGTGASPSRSVSVIRTSDNTELMRIQDVGVEPHGVAVTRDGAYVYVACENVNSPDDPHHPVEGLKTPGIVAVIEVATNRVVRRIEVGAFAAGIAITD